MVKFKIFFCMHSVVGCQKFLSCWNKNSSSPLSYHNFFLFTASIQAHPYTYINYYTQKPKKKKSRRQHTRRKKNKNENRSSCMRYWLKIMITYFLFHIYLFNNKLTQWNCKYLIVCKTLFLSKYYMRMQIKPQYGRVGSVRNARKVTLRYKETPVRFPLLNL